MAQRRDDEAEELLREAWQRLRGTGYRLFELTVLARLDAFLRERGRPDEEVSARLAALAASAQPAVAVAQGG